MKKQLSKIICLSFILIALVSCKGVTSSTSKENIFDPASPGSSTTSGIPNVTSLTVTINSDNTRTIKYNIPSTYTGQSYQIYLYRTVADPTTVTLDDPSQTYNYAYLNYVKSSFEPITANSYIDDTTLISNTTYTYWVYVKMSGKWSTGVYSTFTMPANSTTISIPSPANMWSLYSQYFGQVETANTPGYGVMASCSEGSMVFAEDGGLAYFLDTCNNRILIYESYSYEACKSFDKSSDDYEICKAVYYGYPLQMVAVLGQATFDTKYTCQDSANTLTADQCLTNPKYLSVANGKLVVSDSGNNRILIYPKLPVYGCYHWLNMTGETTANECAPYKVIGKQNLTDLTSYTVASDGQSSLSDPRGVLYKDGNLYIADKGNHRVVMVNDVFNNEVFNCANGTWKTSKCSFLSVLGQSNLKSKVSFNDVYGSSITYNLATHSLSDSGFFLQTHFANPTEIKYANGQLVIVSNENFATTGQTPSYNLYGRISVFNTDPFSGTVPICNSSNWGSTSCQSSYVIGQESFTKLIELDGTTNYEDIPYTFKNIDIDFIGNYLVAIDKDYNYIYTWASIANTSDGIPYVKIVNPNGAYDSTNSRYLPTLSHLVSVEAVSSTGFVYVYDAGLAKVFEIPFKNQ